MSVKRQKMPQVFAALYIDWLQKRKPPEPIDRPGGFIHIFAYSCSAKSA